MKGGIDRYDLSLLTGLSHKVENYSGIRLPKNKPVVGELAFSHESGIHIAAMLEDPLTYENFPPELVGGERHFILGKHTGKKALEHVVASMGCELSDKQICRVLDLVKDHSEQKCSITPDVLRKLIQKAQGGESAMSTLSERILGASAGSILTGSIDRAYAHDGTGVLTLEAWKKHGR